MRVVVALGGHALLRRGAESSIEKQRDTVRIACDALALVAIDNELVVTHGNGPQVGLLALQSLGRPDVPPFPIDVLDAETQGMIGYLLERELANSLRSDKPLATLLTMVEVDRDDPALRDPTKPIGPFYDKDMAEKLTAEFGWTVKPDGDSFRRVVPSPAPRRILELSQIGWLLERRCVVICAGGGGIPTACQPGGQLVGVEAVIDKDRTSALLATGIEARVLVIAMDVDGVHLDWGKPTARRIGRVHPDALMEHAAQFDVGSMRPKVDAACQFVKATGGTAAIGGVTDLSGMLQERAGTIVTLDADGIEFHPPTRAGGRT